MVKKNNGDERVSAVRQCEYAKLRNVNKSTVSAWKRDGWLVFTPAGLVDIEASDRALAGRPGKGRSGADRPDNISSTSADADADSAAARWLEAHGAPHSLSEARRLKENFLMQKHRIELELLQGSVMPRDDVVEVITALVSTINARLWGIPTRAATLLENVQTRLERAQVVESLLEEAVEGLHTLDIQYVEDKLSNVKKRRSNGSKNPAGRGHAAGDDRTDP